MLVETKKGGLRSLSGGVSKNVHFFVFRRYCKYSTQIRNYNNTVHYRTTNPNNLLYRSRSLNGIAQNIVLLVGCNVPSPSFLFSHFNEIIEHKKKGQVIKGGFFKKIIQFLPKLYHLSCLYLPT